jgi:TatD DNase family protein
VEDAATVIVDTHAHLCDRAFDQDLAEVLERAREAGVAAVVSVSEGLAEAERTLELAGRHPMLIPAAGLFPSHPDPYQAEAVAALIRRERSRIRAIGEVGLDYWIAQEEKDRASQRDVLRLFVELSRELDLPLNVHSRSAGRRVIELLLESGAERVQLHAFDAKASSAAPAVQAGYFFSIPPSVVRSPQKQKLVLSLPLENLLVETDSPVLGPDRSERNEPANSPIVIRAIAQLKNLSEEEVLEAVRRNTEQLYGPVHL